MQKTNQEEFRIEKIFKRKGDKLYFKWKGCDNSFNSWINKKDIDCIKMDGYFLKPPSDCENIKIKLNFSNYTTKADIKDYTHVDTSSFALKTN